MLVSSFLNINLTKSHTRTDWSVRPLSIEQLEYAADDVIYLCQIYQVMRDKLKQLGRFEWLYEDFKLLNNPELYQVSPDKAWLKVKGKNKLTGRQLSIIQALTQWREATAQQEDRPRSWLLRDEMLLELAKLQPTTPTELAAVRNMAERTVHRYGKVLCQLISEAKQRPPISLNEKAVSAKKTQQQEAVLDVFTAVVRIRAEENALNPVILAPRKELENLLNGDADCPLLAGWRYSMVGKELEGLLLGEYTLTLQDGVVGFIQQAVFSENT
jgi:ribonuclease D